MVGYRAGDSPASFLTRTRTLIVDLFTFFIDAELSVYATGEAFLSFIALPSYMEHRIYLNNINAKNAVYASTCMPVYHRVCLTQDTGLNLIIMLVYCIISGGDVALDKDRALLFSSLLLFKVCALRPTSISHIPISLRFRFLSHTSLNNMNYVLHIIMPHIFIVFMFVYIVTCIECNFYIVTSALLFHYCPWWSLSILQLAYSVSVSIC